MAETWKADPEGKYEIDKIAELANKTTKRKRGRRRQNPKTVSQCVNMILGRGVKPQQQLPPGLPVTSCLFLKDDGQLPKGIAYKSGSLTAEVSLSSLYCFRDGKAVGEGRRITPKIPVQQLLYAYYKWKSPAEWDKLSLVDQWKLYIEQWKPYYKAQGGVIMHTCDCNSCVNVDHLVLSDVKTNLDNARCEGYQLYTDRLIQVCSHEPPCNRVFIKHSPLTSISINQHQRQELTKLADAQQKVRELQRERGRVDASKRKKNKRQRVDK